MSNPAVIMLTDVSTKSGGRFKIEDNIGEAIHIHYDNFRIDLTIKEFFEFAELIEGCLISLIDNPDFNINNYDPSFLLDIYYMIPDLEGISFEKVFLSELIVARKGVLGVPSWGKLSQSRVLKALNGDDKENNDYLQKNFFRQSNKERVESVSSMVYELGYPFNDEYIVLFNNQKFIRDGQHRAASLYNKNGDAEVEVLRMIFTNNKYNLSDNLWLKSVAPAFKQKIYNLIIRVYKKFKILQKIKRIIFR